MRAAQICVFLIVYLVVAAAHGQLDNFYVEKRQIFYQDQTTGISMPKHGAFLDYYFNLAENTNLVEASFSANLSNVPIQFRDPRQYRGFVSFEDVGALEAVYKDIFYYEFTTQLLGELPKNATVRFTSTGSYSGANPRVSNFSQLSTINAPFNFNLSLTQSAIGSAGVGWQNYIQLTVIDPVSLSGVHVSQYAGTSRTLQIPGGTLGNSREYVARIQFISPDTWSEVGTFNDYRVVSQYSNETWVKLRTLGTYPNFLAELTRYYHWKQTSPSSSQPLADKDYLLARIPTAQNPNVAAASLLQLDVRKGYALDKLPDDENDETLFAYELRGEELDNFVSGLISVGLRYNAGNTRAEMLDWDLEPATTSPRINNWTAAQSIPPESDFDINVRVPNNMTGSSIAATMVIYEKEEDPDEEKVVVAVIEEEFAAASSVSITIPGDTLDQTTEYDATVTIVSGDDVANGIDLRVGHAVDFSIETGLIRWIGVESAAIYRGTYFANGTVATPPAQSTVHTRLVKDDVSSISSANVRDPNGNVKTTLFQNLSNQRILQDFIYYDDASQSLTDFPYVTYTFQTTTGDLTQNVLYAFAQQTAAAPTITVDISHLADPVDPSLPIPISWTGIDVTDDDVFVEVVVSQAFPLTITLDNISADGLSGEIPPNTLATNSSYSVMLNFRRNLQIDDTSVIDASLIFGDEYFTFIPVTTGEAEYSNWLAQFLSPEQLDDPAFTLITANPDGDPLTNLQEYALNGNPLEPTLPPQLASIGILYELRFDFRSGNPLLTYLVEQSTTLVPPFEPYEGIVDVTAGDPYDSIRLTFFKVEQLFIRFITRFGERELEAE